MGTKRRGHWVYACDFGLAKKFIDEKTQKHIKFKKNKALTGTARYTSVNSHLGIEQSRRDDLESLGYMVMYFARGSLPWQGLKAATKEQKYERISERKISTSIESLCKGFPKQFVTYFQYVRTLRFEELPDYAFMRTLFREVMDQHDFKYDFIYDWVKKKNDYVSDEEEEKENAGNDKEAEEKKKLKMKKEKK